MKKILLTGGRNPMTLELVRLLHASGLSVYLADSIRMAFPRYSRYVKSYFCTPHAADDPELFINHLIGIIERNHIDALLPTNEEIFYLAQFPDAFAGKCMILCDKFEKLATLHHKYEMTKGIADCGLKAPETYLLENGNDLNRYRKKSSDYTFKPVYSRFADKVLLGPPSDALDAVRVTTANPYVAQEYISGEEFCSFSIAFEGRLTAHVTYRHPYTLGKGSGIYNMKLDNEEIEQFCRQVCAKYNFTGQIGFDYVMDKGGDYFVIDCNPRTTSGIRFFHHRDNILAAFLGKNRSVIKGSAGHNQMNGLTLFTIHGPKSLFQGTYPRFHHHFSRGQDVIFRCEDPKPFFGQVLTLWEFFRTSLQRKIPYKQTFYTGNAWNGQWKRSMNKE